MSRSKRYDEAAFRNVVHDLTEHFVRMMANENPRQVGHVQSLDLFAAFILSYINNHPSRKKMKYERRAAFLLEDVYPLVNKLVAAKLAESRRDLFTGNDSDTGATYR